MDEKFSMRTRSFEKNFLLHNFCFWCSASNNICFRITSLSLLSHRGKSSQSVTCEIHKQTQIKASVELWANFYSTGKLFILNVLCALGGCSSIMAWTGPFLNGTAIVKFVSWIFKPQRWRNRWTCVRSFISSPLSPRKSCKFHLAFPREKFTFAPFLQLCYFILALFALKLSAQTKFFKRSSGKKNKTKVFLFHSIYTAAQLKEGQGWKRVAVLPSDH